MLTDAQKVCDVLNNLTEEQQLAVEAVMSDRYQEGYADGFAEGEDLSYND